MNRIVHLALKVENLELATEFYKKVFGFQEVETRKTRDHISRHMTDGQLDFSPTFAPNGRLVMYASIVKGRGILAAVSSDGRIKQKITASALDVREPAWGPLVGNRS